MATTKLSAAAANAIVTETMETLSVTIKETLAKGQKSEKLALKHMALSVIHYRDCGIGLAKLQKECKKQKIDFYPYILDEFGIKERMAQRYMRLAKNPKTKDVGIDFFENMKNPTLTNVLEILRMADDDFKAVIDGDNTPLEKDEPSNSNADENLPSENESSNNVPSDSENDTSNENQNNSADDTQSDVNSQNPQSNDVDTDEKPSDESEIPFVNSYPTLFTDDEYKEILTLTKELLIEQLAIERAKVLELKQYVPSNKIDVVGFAFPNIQKEVA